jgi:hypothetical protein
LHDLPSAVRLGVLRNEVSAQELQVYCWHTSLLLRVGCGHLAPRPKLRTFSQPGKTRKLDVGIAATPAGKNRLAIAQ